MPDGSIVVARPARAAQLVLLFHGVGSSAADLVPVGQAIAQERGDAVVVSVDAPHASALGTGREWFSVIGITEQNRPGRIAQAMPRFLDTVARWQAETGLPPEDTVLIGFSQGAIMALESTQVTTGKPAAQRIIALAGRFAEAVRIAPAGLQFHLVHGGSDRVVPTQASVAAAQALSSLGGTVTLDVLPGLGHGIDSQALRLVLAYVAEAQPRRSWAGQATGN